MNEKTDFCVSINKKVSGSGELSESEILHLETCPACSALLEEAVSTVSSSAALKIRSLRKIETESELALRQPARYSSFKLSAILTVLLLAALLFTRYDAGNNSSVNGGRYSGPAIDISFPELSGSGLSDEVRSYFEDQAESFDKSFDAAAAGSMFSVYEGVSFSPSLESIAKTFKLPENAEEQYSNPFSLNGNPFENIYTDESTY